METEMNHYRKAFFVAMIIAIMAVFHPTPAFGQATDPVDCTKPENASNPACAGISPADPADPAAPLAPAATPVDRLEVIPPPEGKKLVTITTPPAGGTAPIPLAPVAPPAARQLTVTAIQPSVVTIPCTTPCTSRSRTSSRVIVEQPRAEYWDYRSREAESYYGATVDVVESGNSTALGITAQQETTARQNAAVSAVTIANQLAAAGASEYYLEVTPAGGLIIDAGQPRYAATSSLTTVGEKTEFSTTTGERVPKWGLWQPGFRNTSKAGWIAAGCVALAGGATGFILGGQDEVNYVNDGTTVTEIHSTTYGLRSALLGVGGAAVGFTAVSFAF